MRLVGPSAERFLLQVEALFLGSAILARKGREVELVGSGGVDPLVGLRLTLSPLALASVEGLTPVRGPVAESAVREQRGESRVKVFRAQARA
jgi:hypothetical protein